MVSPYIYAGLSDKNKMLMKKGIKPAAPSNIIEAICIDLGVSLETLTGSSRKRPLVEGRQIAMAFIRYNNPSLSLMKIGEMFGGRDHATIIYSIRSYEALYKTDRQFQKRVAHIKSLL